MHFDDKYLMKHIRELLKNFTWGCLIHNHTITGAVLEKLMEKLAIPGAKKFFTPWWFSECATSSWALEADCWTARTSPTPFEQVMCEIGILGLVCETILSPLIECSHSLSQQLLHFEPWPITKTLTSWNVGNVCHMLLTSIKSMSVILTEEESKEIGR